MFDMKRAAIAKPIPSSGRSRPKRKAPELTRDKLIEAAGHVFAERGYNDATIRVGSPDESTWSKNSTNTCHVNSDARFASVPIRDLTCSTYSKT